MDINENVRNAISLISDLGAEVESMLEVLSSAMIRLPGKELGSKCSRIIASASSVESRELFSDVDFLRSFKIYQKGGKKPCAFLSCQVDLFPPLPHPMLLYVGLSDEDTRSVEEDGWDTDMYTPDDEDWPLRGGFLASYMPWEDNDGWYKRSWMFSVKLSSLNSPADLSNGVIAPLIDIVNGVDHNKIAEKYGKYIYRPTLT